MNLTELETYLKEHETFTIAEIQHQFSYGYAAVRQAFKELEQAGKICLDNGVTYKWVPNPQPKQVETKESTNNDDKDEDDEYDIYFETMRERRQELMERLARISAEDDDDDEDDFDLDDILDDDDEDDDEKDSRKRRQELWDKLFAEEISKEENAINAYVENQKLLKIIEGFDYGERMKIANDITHKLTVFGVNVKIKAIQIGTDRTRYVFDFLQSKIGISDFRRYRDDIKACIKTDKNVTIIAPYGVEQVAVDVQHDCELDPYCKKALVYWLQKQNGRASIASIQRNLGIGWNRSGQIMGTLEQLNCVDQLNSSDTNAKPRSVKISQENVEVLFPEVLGWED